MIPHEREMAKKFADKPFTILSVSADEEKTDLKAFLEKEKMPWSHWWDGAQGPVSKMFRVKAFPTLYLIDAQGIVKNKWIGVPPTEALDKAVENLVADAERAKR